MERRQNITQSRRIEDLSEAYSLLADEMFSNMKNWREARQENAALRKTLDVRRAQLNKKLNEVREKLEEMNAKEGDGKESDAVDELMLEREKLENDKTELRKESQEYLQKKANTNVLRKKCDDIFIELMTLERVLFSLIERRREAGRNTNHSSRRRQHRYVDFLLDLI